MRKTLATNLNSRSPRRVSALTKYQFGVVCDVRAVAGLQHTPHEYVGRWFYRAAGLSALHAPDGPPAAGERLGLSRIQELATARGSGDIDTNRGWEGTMGHLARVAGAVFLACLVVAGKAAAESALSVATMPEEVGLSSDQLARIEAVTQKYIDGGVVPGAVMLVARRGKIAWYKSMGYRDRATKDAMRQDAIFRIYSMTKPIVTVAAMMLVEEGRMQVSDPVSRYLPEIAQMKVGVEKIEAGRPELELAEPDHVMTVQDLMRHTSGLIYGSRGTSLVNAAYVEA